MDISQIQNVTATDGLVPNKCQIHCYVHCSVWFVALLLSPLNLSPEWNFPQQSMPNVGLTENFPQLRIPKLTQPYLSHTTQCQIVLQRGWSPFCMTLNAHSRIMFSLTHTNFALYPLDWHARHIVRQQHKVRPTENKTNLCNPVLSVLSQFAHFSVQFCNRLVSSCNLRHNPATISTQASPSQHHFIHSTLKLTQHMSCTLLSLTNWLLAVSTNDNSNLVSM